MAVAPHGGPGVTDPGWLGYVPDLGVAMWMTGAAHPQAIGHQVAAPSLTILGDA
ncbi:hypothetical protein AB0G86_34235 [Streptomyces scabiei]|uniref:hypothetical protein n=1 Tax=Streptomyces scabiei TaxID=1930 RepID=UPI0034108302